jgi:hypothetical protein
MFYVTYNIQSSTTLLLLAGGIKGLMVYATFNIVSVIYHTCAMGRGVQESHVCATFNNVSVIYHCRQGVQEGHIFCHFQKCFSYLPLLCCRQGGSGGSWFLPLSILF